MKMTRFLTVLLCVLIVFAVMPLEASALDVEEDETLWGTNEYRASVEELWDQLRSDPENLMRLAGKNRYETSMQIAEVMRDASGAKFYNVVLVSGSDFPDALGAAGPAHELGAPIILVDKNNVKETAQYVAKNIRSESMVYIMGGKGAIPESMETELTAAGVKSDKIKRLAGSNRYKTNIEVLKSYEYITYFLVCSGKSYADALSASGIGKPILLVGDSLTKEQKELIADFGTKNFFIVGGTSAVSEAVEEELKAIAGSKGGKVERFGGKNRFETSRIFADAYWGSYPRPTVVLAYGMNYPDGLSGAPICILYGSPLLLVANSATSDARAIAKKLEATEVIVLGGKALISDEAALSVLDY